MKRHRVLRSESSQGFKEFCLKLVREEVDVAHKHHPARGF